MRYRITHLSDYRYSGTVFLEPQTLRLRPRCDVTQHLISFSQQVSPPPAGESWIVDAEGNSACRLWFNGSTDHLRIETEMLVETQRANPFDYLLEGEGTLPPTYSAAELLLLAPATVGGDDPEILSLSQRLALDAGGGLISFLTGVTNHLYGSVPVFHREGGGPLPPVQTLRGGGSCRDHAILFAEICRMQGVAARFVSGYQEGDADQDERHLHAWVEVYIPGGGWRGFDPTQGLAVADRHIPLAAGTTPEGAAPVSGNFRGTGVEVESRFLITLAADGGGVKKES